MGQRTGRPELREIIADPERGGNPASSAPVVSSQALQAFYWTDDSSWADDLPESRLQWLKIFAKSMLSRRR